MDLRFQNDWRGFKLENLRILVCDYCLDVPQEQLRSIVLPRDPDPIINARPEYFEQYETSAMVQTPTTTDFITGTTIPNTVQMTTIGGSPMTKQPVGPTANPNSDLGLTLDAQMPLVDQIKWAQPIPFLSIMANGTPVVTVTCSSPHGLSTNAQIAVAGTSVPQANGFFSVTVTTATAFTYQTVANLASGSLIMPGTQMVTANAGLPRGMVQVPQV